MTEKVVLLTGGSSGIGLAAACALRDAGCRVYEISRRDHSEVGITHIGADITNGDAVSAAVSRVIEAEGRIDVLINNAGMGISGAVEFTDETEIRRLFDVDFFAADRLVRAVLPYMREAGQGRIVHVSSVAARIPIPFQTYYSAAKAALNAYTSALDAEIRPLGLHACAVMPGDIRTGFTESREKLHKGDDCYDGRIGRSVLRMEHDEMNGMPPERVAKILVKAVLTRRKRIFYGVGSSYRFFLLLQKILPAGLVAAIVRRMYG